MDCFDTIDSRTDPVVPSPDQTQTQTQTHNTNLKDSGNQTTSSSGGGYERDEVTTTESGGRLPSPRPNSNSNRSTPTSSDADAKIGIGPPSPRKRHHRRSVNNPRSEGSGTATPPKSSPKFRKRSPFDPLTPLNDSDFERGIEDIYGDSSDNADSSRSETRVGSGSETSVGQSKFVRDVEDHAGCPDPANHMCPAPGPPQQFAEEDNAGCPDPANHMCPAPGPPSQRSEDSNEIEGIVPKENLVQSLSCGACDDFDGLNIDGESPHFDICSDPGFEDLIEASTMTPKITSLRPKNSNSDEVVSDSAMARTRVASESDRKIKIHKSKIMKDLLEIAVDSLNQSATPTDQDVTDFLMRPLIDLVCGKLCAADALLVSLMQPHFCFLVIDSSHPQKTIVFASHGFESVGNLNQSQIIGHSFPSRFLDPSRDSESQYFATIEQLEQGVIDKIPVDNSKQQSGCELCILPLFDRNVNIVFYIVLQRRTETDDKGNKGNKSVYFFPPPSIVQL